ncbi:hypothetical protein BH10CYA1_BH10CYA1_61700 [soil metagenome]
MPHRILVSQQLAKLFSTLSHPARIRIVTELRSGDELCVNSLQERLGIPHCAVSQHLALLRTHNLIKERRRGRHVFYRLTSVPLSAWLVDGIQFIVPDQADSDLLKYAIERTVAKWSHTSESDDSTSRKKLKARA